MPSVRQIRIEGELLQVSGNFFRIARLPSEHYDSLANPDGVLDAIRRKNPGIDVLTFLQGIPDPQPHYPFRQEWDTLAVLSVGTYEDWWSTISCKTRNLVRKAGKKGVEIREASLDHSFIKAIEQIYAESPVRQGKRFRHYRKGAEAIRADLATFDRRSAFYGAYHQGELIGFTKLVAGDGFLSLMHILSSLASRDLSPTNALLDHAVKVCAQRKIPYLLYGDWSRGGLGLFKRNHGFRAHRIPRYWVPFNCRGRLWLAAGFHHTIRERIPAGLKDGIVKLRGTLTHLWYRETKAVPAK